MDIESILKQMTVEEKAVLVSGTEISRGKIIQTHFREHALKPLEIRHFVVVA